MTLSSPTHYFLIFLTVLIRTSAHHAEFCNNTRNFTLNSAYAKNRDTILSTLSDDVSAHDKFYNTSTGQNPNTIYALTFCRGDTSANICKDCVGTAVHDLVEKCTNQKAAFSWGTGGQPCFIRYSDTPIYGILQTKPTLLLYEVDNITMSPATWWNLTQRVVNKAVDSSSKLKFATGQTNLPDNRTIYSYLQCSPDLSANNCRTCLYEAIDYHGECCRGRQASGVYKPSCIFRWDLYPFLGSSQSPLPSSWPPPAALPAPHHVSVVPGHPTVHACLGWPHFPDSSSSPLPPLSSIFFFFHHERSCPTLMQNSVPNPKFQIQSCFISSHDRRGRES